MPQKRHTPELKLLHGATANTHPPKVTPAPAARTPKRPDDLTPRETAIWEVVVAELADMSSLAAADTFEILAYVRLVAAAESIAVAIRSEPMTSTHPETGIIHANPLLAAYERLTGRAHHLANGLGLNPHARTMIHGVGRKPDTEAAHTPDLYAI